MKKRMLSILLACAMLTALLPQLGLTAFADPVATPFYGRSLVLENDIAIRYYVEKASFAYEAPKVIFSFEDNESEETSFTETDAYYVFTFRGLLSKDMTRPVTATLYGFDGSAWNEIGSTVDTIKNICLETMDAYPDDQALQTLIADILVYGAKSQEFFESGSAQELATDGLTPAQLANASTVTPELTSVANTNYQVLEGADVTWFGANLSLQDSVKLQFFFQAPSKDMLVVSLRDENGALLASFTEDAIEKIGNYYRVCYDGFGANEFRKPVYISASYGIADDLLGGEELPFVMIGGGVGSNTLSFSVESYAVAARAQYGSNEKLMDLVDAMMRYGASAEVYAYELKYPSEKTRRAAEAYFADPAFDEEVYYVGPTREHTSLISLLLDMDGDAYDAANNNQNKKTIYIDEGEYDFFAEYMAEVYDAESNPHGRILQPVEPETAEEKTTKNIASSQYLEAAGASQNCLPVDRNSTNADGQKFWLNAFVPNNTKIIGVGNVVVRFEPTADQITYNASKTWSPFNIFGSVMIENIDVYGHNCRYVLHNDDHNRYLNTYQYYKDFNLTYTVSDLSTCGVNVGSGIYYGFNHTVGYGVNNGATHVFDHCELYLDLGSTSMTSKGAYYGHNASGTAPGECAILLTQCNIHCNNSSNASVIRLQTLSKTNAGHVITTIDRCTTNGGVELHNYYAETVQSYDVTFVETPGMPITFDGPGAVNPDPYTVKYVRCEPAA